MKTYHVVIALALVAAVYGVWKYNPYNILKR